MVTLERSDHFFNSPEAGGIGDYHESVEEAAMAFIDRTAIDVDVEELVEDYLKRV